MDKYLYSRCDICLDEACRKAGKQPGTCNCKDCSNLSNCDKFLHATIRITNKCTQSCKHCCFSSNPKSEIFMSVQKAKEIQSFINNNGILMLNIMGGEFFCNPNWFEILNLFLESKAFHLRLVSNGDWHSNNEVKEKISYLAETFKDKLKISISYDKYHTNSWVEHKLDGFLELLGIKFDAEKHQVMEDSAIVPIGRAMYSYSFYSTMGQYCNQIGCRYSFLIDENGQIYRCGFGVYPYSNIKDYLEGGFRSVFKKEVTKFCSLPILNCRICISAFEENFYSGKNLTEKRGFKCLERR